MKSQNIVLTLIAILYGVVCNAQDNYVDTLSTNIVKFDEVVVLASGAPKKLKDTPVPVSVITARELKKGNIFTLEDALLKLSPSITTMTNGMGTTVSFNGMNDDYFVFLLNGKRMDGDNAIERIDFSNVVRIEMLSGASSVLYGTNAIGGVINIVTDGASQENGVSGSAKTQVTSHERYRSAANVDIKSGKLVSNTAYTRNESGGWQLSEYELSKDELVKTDKVASTGFVNNNISQDFQYLASDKLTLAATGSYYHNKTDRPQSIYSYNLEHESYNYSLGGLYKLNDTDKLELDYYSDNFTSSYNYFKDYSKGSTNISKGDVVMRKKTKYNNVNAKSYFDLGNKQTLYSGLEYENNNLSSVSDDLENKRAYSVSMFSQYEVKFSNNFSALGGLRYTYHQTFNSHATYHASLQYAIKGLNVRASYSTGFKAPTLTQLYAEKVTTSINSLSLPNINLRPETSDYLSLNVEYSNKWISASLSGFHNNIRNMITYKVLSEEELASNPEYSEYSEVARLENVDKAKIKGVNASVTFSPGAGFMIGGGYSFIDSKDLATNMPIDKSVRNVFTVNANWGHTWNNYSLDIALNGRISDERYSVSYGYAPKYQLWDLVTSHVIVFDNITIEPSIGIENIFNFIDDRPFNSNYATLSPGRSVFASLTIRF